MTLDEWMTRQGLSDAELALRLGGTISRSQVSRIRAGKSAASRKSAQKLEEVTGLPAANFVFGKQFRADRAEQQDAAA